MDRRLDDPVERSSRLYKYPRTPHLEGSRKQPGDQDLESVPFRQIAGRHLVVEEKVDGANAAISFDRYGGLRLQSRGHFLTGGGRERHFALFKAWAAAHQTGLFAALGSRYVLYGEWLYAKHTIFYDALSHYFLEYDALDTQRGVFLSTPERQGLLAGLPIVPVPVLHAGELGSLDALTAVIGPSRFKGPHWCESLRERCGALGLAFERIQAETDPSDLMEGLYVKVEEGGEVVERYKWVRADYLTTVRESGSHWLSRPIVPNGLRPGTDIYAASAVP